VDTRTSSRCLSFFLASPYRGLVQLQNSPFSSPHFPCACFLETCKQYTPLVPPFSFHDSGPFLFCSSLFLILLVALEDHVSAFFFEQPSPCLRDFSPIQKSIFTFLLRQFDFRIGDVLYSSLSFFRRRPSPPLDLPFQKFHLLCFARFSPLMESSLFRAT